MKTRISLAVSFVAILAVAFAYGQGTSSVQGRVNVPFKFMVGKKEMPAGKYEILRQAVSAPVLLFRSEETNTTAQLVVIERLARTEDSPSRTAKVVFNTADNQKVLSEFWPSGTDDGYLLQVTKQEHKHEIVKEQ